jgi:hypothetical protein
MRFNRAYDGGLTRTGYYTAGGALKSSEAAGASVTSADKILDDPSKLNKSLLKTMKRHDPVEYDHLYRRDFMVSTAHAFHDNKHDA